MNFVHPSAQIGDSVRLGEDNYIGAFVVIEGTVEIGDRNWIGTGTVIGAPPEVRSFRHPRQPHDGRGPGVRIGSDSVIREYAQIHGGWKKQTIVGDRAFIMNQVYVAHDCTIGDDVTLASGVALAGHAEIATGANLGLKVSVHQNRYVGALTMVGMGAVVTRDLPPFSKAYGVPAVVRGFNTVGVARRGVSAAAVRLMEQHPVTDEVLAQLAALEDMAAYLRGWQTRA